MAQPPKKRPNVEELVRRWEADKKRSRLFLQIAEEYRKDDFVDAALTVLKEGLKHHPNFAPAHVSLARCYMAKRQWTEAQGELERVHEKSPDNLLAGKLLVQVLEERGEKGRALQVAKELVPFAAFADPEVEATAERLEAELGGAGAPSGEEPSDTMDFAKAEDTGELRGPDAETTANLEAADADTTANLEAADAETTANLEAADAETTANLEAADAETTASFGDEPTGDDEEPEIIDGDAFADEGETQMLPSTDASSPPDEGASELFQAVPPSPKAEETEEEPFGAAEDEPFGAAEEPEPAPEVAADGTTPEAEPFGAPSGPLPGTEEGAPEDLLGGAPAAAPAAADDDLTSVTLAELYEAQESHEEAAAIYEKLLGKRPDDADLRAALERCRARVAGPGTEAGAEEEAAAATAPAVPKWEPEPTAAPAPADARSPAEPAQEDAPGPEQWKAVLAEYERWLAAARAVRQ